MTLSFDLLTLKVVSESRVTWATSVPILVFLGLSVFELGPMYATDRRQINACLRLLWAGHNRIRAAVIGAWQVLVTWIIVNARYHRRLELAHKRRTFSG